MENTQLLSQVAEDERDSSQNSWQSPSRIHFPLDESTSGRSPRHRPENYKLPSGLTPPVRRGSPLNPQNIVQATESRRRPWLQDTLLSPGDTSLRHRRNASFTQGSTTRFDSEPNPLQDRELESSVFSDEYDLSHEDPRILQDVQRALKMKARREARLKREATIKSDTPSPQSSSTSPHASTPPKKQTPLTFSPSPVAPSTNRKLSSSTISDVDFSPSIAVYDQMAHMHPVPSSIDNGATLDWTGTNSEDGDRRWLGIGKKRDKDKLPPLGFMISQQEHFHETKISSIKQSLSAQTARKADITSDQLERRYSITYDAIEERRPLNLAAVSRWYGSQPDSLRSSLEKAEPFTWLKHLDKRTQKIVHSPRNLMALIVEEYVKAESRQDYMQTIPEDSIVVDPDVPARPRKSRSPSFLSTSRARGVGSSLSMGISVDDQVSFGPFGEVKRTSLDAGSRRSGDSRPNSVHSGSSNPGFLPLSPLSNRSAENKTADNQFRHTIGRSRSPGSSSTDLSDESVYSSKDPLPKPLQVPEVSIHPPSAENTPLPDPSPILLEITKSHESSSSSQAKHTAAKPTNPSLKVLQGQPNFSGPKRSQAQHRKTMDREVLLRREYENKAHLLRDTVAHNNRIRQFLNRISAAMKDFNLIQNTAMRTQGIHTVEIPKDLLEAFGHDPSAVTGTTRRDRGWRAVEDINYRVDKQRNVFKAFIQSFANGPDSSGCSLDESIKNITQTLELLERHKLEIMDEANAVSELLESVQSVHTRVKDNYNSTLSHVSIAYPELSHIVALEESYKDQYQHVWELGMDALTLLLDTVTPFWRTYGKTIGEDVRDFLIIPLYRNEFTGESKAYPISAIPKRSHRHRFGLVFFFFLSIAVNILQTRAAISSSLHFRLHLIPYDGIRWTALPFFWIAIIIQWMAVVVEFAIVFLQLGVITWWIGWSVKLWS